MKYVKLLILMLTTASLNFWESNMSRAVGGGLLNSGEQVVCPTTLYFPGPNNNVERNVLTNLIV
jgi:hypothetical protein